MKKILMITLVIGMMVLVSAVLLGTKTIDLDTEYENTINSINNDTIQRGNITCDNLEETLTGSETCSQRMWKGNYQLGETTIPVTICKDWGEEIDENNQTIEVCINWVAIKDDKIIEELTKQQGKQLEEIAKTIIKRAEKLEDKIIEDEGEVILE